MAPRASGGRREEIEMEATQKRTVTPMESTQRKVTITEEKKVVSRQVVTAETLPSQSGRSGKTASGSKQVSPDSERTQKNLTKATQETRSMIAKESDKSSDRTGKDSGKDGKEQEEPKNAEAMH